MLKLSALKLSDIMPSNLIADNEVNNCAAALDPFLQGIANNARLVLILYRLDELDDDVLDLLAWQYHVDTYSTDLAIAAKRDLIRNSILWHMKKGTPYAVRTAVTAIYGGAKMQENWEYGGEAYHFRVAGITDSIKEIDTAKIKNLVKVINQSKNARSVLDGVEFSRSIAGSVYTAGATWQHKDVTISINKFTMPDITTGMYVAGAQHILKEVTING